MTPSGSRFQAIAVEDYDVEEEEVLSVETIRQRLANAPTLAPAVPFTTMTKKPTDAGKNKGKKGVMVKPTPKVKTMSKSVNGGRDNQGLIGRKEAISEERGQQGRTSLRDLTNVETIIPNHAHPMAIEAMTFGVEGDQSKDVGVYVKGKPPDGSIQKEGRSGHNPNEEALDINHDSMHTDEPVGTDKGGGSRVDEGSTSLP